MDLEPLLSSRRRDFLSRKICGFYEMTTRVTYQRTHVEQSE
jgi:hypothetical protein